MTASYGAYVLSATRYRNPWSPRQAFFYAGGEVRSPDKNYTGQCDHFVAWCYGWAGSGQTSAIQHWGAIPSGYKFTRGTPPAGALVFWSVGRYGHVAISAGDGTCFSTDFRRTGKVDRVRIADITKGWGARYLGWSRPVFPNGFGKNPNKPPRLPS